MSYTLPDGQVIPIEAPTLCKSGEGLFYPEQIHKECFGVEGIHSMIDSSIKEVDIDIRRDMYSNIILSGGNTLITNLPERLEKELEAMK